MKYINMDDLTTVIQNRLLVESIEKDEEVLDGIEDLVISEVSAYISGRYDVKKIRCSSNTDRVINPDNILYYRLSCSKPECSPQNGK